MAEVKLVAITNRDSGHVGYSIPERGIQRSFAPQETKQIPLDELQQLQWVSGGKYILENLLMINDKDALSALNMEVEPEYFYTEVDIRELLSSGTLDQLKDALDFAPQGAIELIKKIAIETELPDTRKRKAISEATGFNIDSAININAILNAETEEEENKNEKSQRRATPIKNDASAETARRTTPKYKVVAK